MDAAETVKALGRRIRELRQGKGLTLQAVSARSGLSASLISMVERGVTAPSIGTLVALASVLGVSMGELMTFPEESPGRRDPVIRVDRQPTYETLLGVVRRVVQKDEVRGFEWAVNEYAPGTASADGPIHHEGHEFGMVIEGRLVVELGASEHVLGPGDSISYASSLPHRLRNDGKRRARAAWLNFST